MTSMSDEAYKKVKGFTKKDYPSQVDYVDLTERLITHLEQKAKNPELVLPGDEEE